MIKQPVKILGDGELTKKLTVIAGWYSKSAHEKITEAGGTAQNLKGEAFEFPKPKKKFVPREPVKKKSDRGAGEAKRPRRRSARKPRRRKPEAEADKPAAGGDG